MSQFSIQVLRLIHVFFLVFGLQEQKQCFAGLAFHKVFPTRLHRTNYSRPHRTLHHRTPESDNCMHPCRARLQNRLHLLDNRYRKSPQLRGLAGALLNSVKQEQAVTILVFILTIPVQVILLLVSVGIPHSLVLLLDY